MDEVRFEPAAYAVGDRVLARVVVDSSVTLTEPAVIAAGDWLVVHGVEVLPRTDGRWEVRVLFSSFLPGPGTLPPIDVGPLQLTGIGFDTGSVLPRYDDPPVTLRPLRAQVFVPGTRALFIGGALALFAVPYLAVSGVVALAGTTRRRRARRARAQPRLRLQRGVERLRSAGPSNDGPERLADPAAYYTELSRLARTYLAERLELPAQALTVTELRATFPAHGLPQGLGADLAAILETADRVKFAGRDSGAAEMDAAARQLVTLAQAVDAILAQRARIADGESGVEL